MKLRSFPHLWLLVLPLLLIFLGATSNQVVIYANHGKFPVMVSSRQKWDFQQKATADSDAPQLPDDGMLDDTHSIMIPSDHLKFLADWINLGDGIYSPGDMILLLGAFLWSFCSVAWLVLVVKERWEAGERF